MSQWKVRLVSLWRREVCSKNEWENFAIILLLIYVAIILLLILKFTNFSFIENRFSFFTCSNDQTVFTRSSRFLKSNCFQLNYCLIIVCYRKKSKTGKGSLLLQTTNHMSKLFVPVTEVIENRQWHEIGHSATHNLTQTTLGSLRRAKEKSLSNIANLLKFNWVFTTLSWNMQMDVQTRLVDSRFGEYRETFKGWWMCLTWKRLHVSIEIPNI